MSLTASYLTQEALGGLSAGIIGTLIGYPLDVMKTRQQTGVATTGRGISVITGIIRQDGIMALYRGVGPPLLSLSLLNTMSFTSYSFFRRIYGGQDGWDIKNGLAGMTGAPAFAFISTVENRIKTQMQLPSVLYRYDNSWHCAQSLIRQEGFSSLYKGNVVNTLREAVFLANYFFMYEGMRELLLLLHQEHHQHHLNDTETMIGTTLISPKLAIPMAGGIAGMTSWAVSFPLDCVRAGVQRQTKSSQMGAITVFQELVRQHGIAGLYNGVGPSVARAFLVSGSRFSAYEGAIWVLRGGRSRHEDER